MNADPDGPQPERHGRWRLAVLAVLLAGGAGLIGLLARNRPASPLQTSLAMPFQLLGTPVQLADRLASRAIPVGACRSGSWGTPSGAATKPRSNRAMPTRPTWTG